MMESRTTNRKTRAVKPRAGSLRAILRGLETDLEGSGAEIEVLCFGVLYYDKKRDCGEESEVPGSLASQLGWISTLPEEDKRILSVAEDLGLAKERERDPTRPGRVPRVGDQLEEEHN
jgi:hypothetical protein